jgi:hypothetical protein
MFAHIAVDLQDRQIFRVFLQGEHQQLQGDNAAMSVHLGRLVQA